MMRAGLLLVCYATAIDVLPFVTTYDNVLPPEIVDEMLAEAKVLGPMITGSWWLDQRATLADARTFGETAMILLRPLVLQELGLTDSEQARLIGAEYWYKIVADAASQVEFHTDKDESLSFSHMGQLRQPLLSVVTYLTNGGGPTCLLDIAATSVSAWHPRRPRYAALSEPTPNKILFFNGSAIHSVLKDDSLQRARITFIHNYWFDRRPAEPYCADVPARLPKRVQRRLAQFRQRVAVSTLAANSEQCAFFCESEREREQRSFAAPQAGVVDTPLAALALAARCQPAVSRRRAACQRLPYTLVDGTTVTGQQVVAPVDAYAYGGASLRVRIPNVENYRFLRDNNSDGGGGGRTWVYRLDDRFTELVEGGAAAHHSEL